MPSSTGRDARLPRVGLELQVDTICSGSCIRGFAGRGFSPLGRRVLHGVAMTRGTLRVLAEDELSAVLREIVREAIANEAGAGQGSPWMDLEGAAEYTSMSSQAIRSAEKRGQVKGYRSVTGRLRFHRKDLDLFLRGEVAL